MHNRDLKLVITSKGNTTGTGKTTLAIHIARFCNRVANDVFDRNITWSAKEFSFMNVNEYLQQYRDAPAGTPLITDELEFLADRRRSMSNQNVYFSQAWEMLRYRNIITIGTAPGLWDLDKRIPENTDIWINVVERGRANPYYLQVNDFTGEIMRKRLKLNGYRETIKWPALDGDSDFEYLNETKREIGVPGLSQTKDITKEDLKEAKRTELENITINLLERKQEGEIHLTQAEIGDIVGRSQQWVATVKRENL